jgi:hypothetical protein
MADAPNHDIKVEPEGSRLLGSAFDLNSGDVVF